MTIVPQVILRPVIDPKSERVEKSRQGVIMNRVISTTCTRCRQDIIHCRCDIRPARRMPLEGGMLELTNEELDAIESMSAVMFIQKVVYTAGKIRIKTSYGLHVLSNIKAIMYILKRFKLEED